VLHLPFKIGFEPIIRLVALNEAFGPEDRMSILMVVTSNDRLGDTGKPTGLWLEEFATPYYIFRDEGVKVVLASPEGGRPPIDPRSEKPQAQTDATRRFFKDKDPQQAFDNTTPLSTISPDDYDAAFYPGGQWSALGPR
jgi:putative intracellular protease/amidase